MQDFLRIRKTRMHQLPFFQDAFDEGYKAFKDGFNTLQLAKLANPYRLFAHRMEHAHGISWNKGWNKAYEETKVVN